LRSHQCLKVVRHLLCIPDRQFNRASQVSLRSGVRKRPPLRIDERGRNRFVFINGCQRAGAIARKSTSSCVERSRAFPYLFSPGMNLPNKLTVARFVLTAIFLVIFFNPFKLGNSIALVVFISASLTDYFDGKIARRDKLITNFGILMDPLADKILICSAFIAFVGRDLMPAWMVVIIVGRELAITGLRLLAASKQRVMAAERYGKHKTISQIVAIISVLVLISYREWGSWAPPIFQWWVPAFTELTKWVSVALTAISGGIYLWRNRDLYLNEK
jgi:CDP-diacylglycerol---glycerol-3-phosphate 3-phosphatidyltransferase